MATTAADVLIETLLGWGVDVVFGLPGDGINGIMEALRTRQDRIRFVQVRHEEAAAFMACGYAKFTGRLGVCLATSGPGGIHLLNGLYDAALDGQPVLAITGMPYHDLIGTHTQQDVALDRLFMDVAKFNERIMGPAHVENVTDLACRSALAYRGVAHLTFPVVSTGQYYLYFGTNDSVSTGAYDLSIDASTTAVGSAPRDPGRQLLRMGGVRWPKRATARFWSRTGM